MMSGGKNEDSKKGSDMVTILNIFVLTISFNVTTIMTENNNLREIKLLYKKALYLSRVNVFRKSGD